MDKKQTLGARIPPQDLDAEKALLGSIMLSPDSLHDITDIISGDTFYSEKNKIVFENMVELAQKREPIDLVSVTNKLKEKKVADSIKKVKQNLNLKKQTDSIKKAKDSIKKVTDSKTKSKDSKVQLTDPKKKPIDSKIKEKDPKKAAKLKMARKTDSINKIHLEEKRKLLEKQRRTKITN